MQLFIIDEFQTFTDVATTSYEKLLSRARKYRLGLILAHQQTGQIPLSLLKEIWGNVSTMVSFLKDPEQRINFTPDGVFALEKDGNAALFFVEIDRGTEILSNPDKGVLKAIYFYYNYFISGKYQRYTEDFKCQPFKGFRVLLVTTTELSISVSQNMSHPSIL